MHDDTPALLETLCARGYTLGVVSNADGRVAASLDACGIAPHFKVVIDSHVVGVEKPDPRIFRLALDACGTHPEETIYIGDIYEIDIVGARNAGIRPFLLDPLSLYGEVDCERIDSLTRLLELLPGHARSGGGAVV
jgi:HAD superfamily hydrolase (TIGR01509 family)